jgi:hypothetical protein
LLSSQLDTSRHNAALTTEVWPSSWVKQRMAVAAWWKTWRNASCQSHDSERTTRRASLTQRLLLEHEEDGVNELDVFDVVVDHVESDESLRLSVLLASAGRM